MVFDITTKHAHAHVYAYSYRLTFSMMKDTSSTKLVIGSEGLAVMARNTSSKKCDAFDFIST